MLISGEMRKKQKYKPVYRRKYRNHINQKSKWQKNEEDPQKRKDS